ncbi:MAG: hypothetical protein QM703_15925 [Gemmatales bacterium]
MKAKGIWFFFIIAALVPTTRTVADDFSIAATASQTSVFVEYFSAAFSRINLTSTIVGNEGLHGFSPITLSPAALRTYVPTVHYGSANVFPNDANFFSTSSLSYDGTGLTGVGIESRTVTALNGFEVHNDFGFRNFSTTIGALTGNITSNPATITWTNGVVSNVDLLVPVNLTFGAGFISVGQTYVGSFSISGNQFLLNVDDTKPSGVPDTDAQLCLARRWGVESRSCPGTDYLGVDRCNRS